MENPPSSHRKALFFTCLSACLLVIALLLWFPRKAELDHQANTAQINEPKPTSKGVGNNEEEARSAKVSADFQKWLSDSRTIQTSDSLRQDQLTQGLQLAAQRKSRMVRLIRENPEQAIKESITFDQWLSLPEEMKKLVEKPFSERADYTYLPVCAPPGKALPADAPDHIGELNFADGSHLEAFVYGQRGDVMTKRGLPVQGIALEGMAAIRDGVMQLLKPQESNAARLLFTSGQPNESVSFVTGAPVGATAVQALAGGKLFTFANADELIQFNHLLAKLDAKPGPEAGSKVIFMEAYSPAGTAGFNLSAAQSYVFEQADAWTEQPKKVFLIRVDFSDKAGVPVTQAAAASEMNGATTTMISQMSYGKTSIIGTVSANLYRLPQTAAYYADTANASYGSSSFSSKNADLIRDARNTFRNTKSGGDSAINIGAVSLSGNGDSNGLGDYDIVGVFFASIGSYSGGVGYAGLAGGGNLWVQNANYTSLYVHELGHNYGLGHSSFWQTTDGSVVGTGSSVEYGDDFDVMGNGPTPQGHYHPQGKAKLNWLTTAQWSDATVSGSNTYRVYREDDANTVGAPRGVRVTKAATLGNEEYYWIGYKPLFTDNTHLQRGAYLVWQRPGQTRSWLIDMTPNTSGVKTDAPLDLGRTYADTTANIFVTPVAVGGAGSEAYLDVRVNIGPFPGNHAPTAAAISGPTTLAARTSGSFSITASDSDSDTLAYSWASGDGAVNNNSSSLSHTWMVGGTYTLTATVSDMKGGSVVVSKTVTVTDPLDTWTSGSVGTTGSLREAVWGKGRFVTADYFGNIFHSWDGSSWSNVGQPPDMDQPKLAYGNNVFVAAGTKESASTNAQIAYSLDGRTWSSATFTAGLPLIRAVTYGGGKFVAVASSGTVFRSTDGITWSLTTVSGLPDFRSITYDGSTWIAIAYNSSASHAELVWTSLDGISWSQGPSLGVDVSSTYSTGGTAYALGWYGGVMYSTDHGVTWQNASLPSSTRWSTYLMAAAEDGTLLVTARAMDESGSPYANLVSRDGRTWSRSSADATISANSYALTYGFGKFLTVESNGVIRMSTTFFPSNTAPSVSFTANPSSGSARQPIYFAATGTDANGDALTYAWDFGSPTIIQDGFEIAPTFAFGGSYTATLRVTDSHGGLTTLTQNINISDPARTFTQRTSGTTNSLNAVAANSSLIVAAGDSGTILTSTDGSTWSARAVSEYTGNIYFKSILWDGSKFVLVGKDYNFSIPGWIGIVYTSPDGITWTRRYASTAANTELYGVAYSGSAYAAVGNKGTLLRSTDATSWSSVTVAGITTSQTLAGVAYGGGVFAFTGYSGSNGTAIVFTSSDGTNWVNRSSGTGVASWQDIRQIAFLNNRFVGSGWYSKLCVSTDNGQSFSSNRAHAEELFGMAYGDGFYFTAGIDHDASNADIDVLSQDGVNWYQFAAPTTADRNGAVFYKHTFITVGAGGSIWQSADTSPSAGFAAWQTSQFPSGGLSSLASRDPDGDGVSNVLEYALSRNPKLSTGLDGPSGIGYALTQSGRAWLHLDLPEPAMSDVTYTIQGVTNLGGTWSNLASKTGTSAWSWLGGGSSHINQGSLNGGRIPVEVGMPDSANGQPRYFLRLQVSTP